MSELGIRVVFDLRNADEHAARPSRLPVDVELLERVSQPTGGDVRTIEELIAVGELPVPDDEYFATVYVDLLDRLAPELRIILERAVDARRRGRCSSTAQQGKIAPASWPRCCSVCSACRTT